MSHVYCSECGFQNPESANYCSRCGAHLVGEGGSGDTTMTFTPEEIDTDAAVVLDEMGLKGPALVVRSGGGRAGETFQLEDERTTIGRSPDSGIFLDDVTVSRRHAVIVKREGRCFIEDEGSLNGTFLNRRRIDSAELHDDDELQVGKYRLTFLDR